MYYLGIGRFFSFLPFFLGVFLFGGKVQCLREGLGTATASQDRKLQKLRKRWVRKLREHG